MCVSFFQGAATGVANAVGVLGDARVGGRERDAEHLERVLDAERDVDVGHVGEEQDGLVEAGRLFLLEKKKKSGQRKRRRRCGATSSCVRMLRKIETPTNNGSDDGPTRNASHSTTTLSSGKTSMKKKKREKKQETQARTGVEGEEPRDGKEIGRKANLVEVGGELRVVEGEQVAHDGERLLQDRRVVVREKVVQEPRNEGLQARKSVRLAREEQRDERRAHRVEP